MAKLYSHSGHEHGGSRTVLLCSPQQYLTATPLCFHMPPAVRVYGHSAPFSHTSP